VPFRGEGKLTKLIRSQNLLVADHEAEIEWNGKKHLIDYGEGCRYFWDFLDKRIYLSENGENTLITLPGNRGQCSIRLLKELGRVENTDPEAPDQLHGLDYQAQNNQVYFYWEEPENENLLYLISYSRFRINTDDYHWKEMPNLISTKRNSFTVRRLMNRRPYYFYLAAVNEDNVAGSWTQIRAIPVAGRKVENNPNPEEFEIEIRETDDAFYLSWPEKEKARRFIAKFYLNGKQEKFKILKEGVNEYVVEKKPEYLNKRLRFTIKSISKSRFGPSYYDGHFWVYRSGPEKKYNKKPLGEY
jgi:hypothetical protein